MKVSLSRTSLIVFLGVTLSISSGCFNPGDGIPYYEISSEFASYCWFEEGSSWTYQNDSTLATESIAIEEVTISKRFAHHEVDYNYQAVEMFFAENTFGITRHELTAGDYETAPGEMNSLLRMYRGDGSYQIVFSPQYEIGDEIILGDEIGNYTNIEIIASMELNGNTYLNVYHTKVTITVGDNIEYNYWIAINYGLIKYVTTTNGQSTSISLKSSNLTGL